MGKQKIDISVFDEAVKKLDVSAFDEAVKKKEPSASSELPLQSQEEVSVSVGVEPPTIQGDTTAEQGRIEVPSVLNPIEYEPADFGDVNPAAVYGDYQNNERALAKVNQTLEKYEQAQSQVRTDDISFGRNTQADLSGDIQGLKKRRQALLKEQANISDILLNPVVKESSQLYLNEDGTVKEEYYTKNFYGMKVPNVERINDLVGERIEDKGLRVKLAEKIQGDIDFNLNIDQEELASLAKEKIKSKLDDIQGEREELFDSQYGKDVANAYANALREIKTVSTVLGDEYKSKATEIDSELKQITTDYEAYSTQLKSGQYTTQEEVDQANELLQKAYSDYQKSYSDAVTKNAQLLNAYNAKINKRAQEVQAAYQERVNQMAEQFGKDNPIPPELIDKAYQEALSEQMAKVREAKEFVVSQGGLPLRFGTSTLSSFGSFIEMVGASFGGDGEAGKQMQQYFQPAVDPIEGFRDLTLYNLVESSGNLAGSMIPSVVASATAAAATRNLSTGARLMSTALAGFTSETADLMGRSYRDALKRSGSVEEAKNAATETFNSQLVLAPTYVLDALPFVGGIKGIKNPALRFGANGLLEYTTETFLQEYPQNIMERAISETGEYESAPSFASLESLEETAANTLATIPFGGATAAMSSETTTPTPDQFIQKLDKVLRSEGLEASTRLITELYTGGQITEDEMGMLSSIVEDIDTNNSEQYNAVKFRRDLVSEAADQEQDEAKKKTMNKYVKAYDDILERMLGGEKLTIPTQKIAGEDYYTVPANPISFLNKLDQDEKVQQEDQELRKQEGEIKKEEERIRQEEQTRVLEEFDAVEDNETVTITSKTLEEIPEQFRDRAEKVEGVEVETKKTFLGIPYGKAESTTVGDGYRYNATGEEIRNAINQEEQTIVADEKASIKEPMLEEPQDGGVQKEGEQESAELRSETQEVDAVQEQQAEGVDVREQAEVSEEVVEEVRGEEIVAGDKVTVTYEDYVRGKKTKKQRRGVIDSVNPDGSFNIRAKEGVYKNISPEGVSKVKSTPTVESETQGLTEKERFVQGFKEIMSAKDEKIRQAKESVKEKLSQARAKFGERMSAQRKKVSEAKTARAELGRLISLEMKELGLSDVRASRVKSMLSSMKNITPNNIDSVIERAYGLVVAEAKAQRLNTYKKKSKEAKRRIQRGDFDTVSVGMIPLMELDVRAILDEDIKRYTELVDDFSRRGKFAVEDVAAKIQEANEIVNRAAEQLGLREVEASNIAQGLTEENYNKAISELVASGDITQDMADFMRANKKRLLELEKKPVNKEQVFFEIQDKIEFVKNNQQDLSDRPVKQKAQDVISSVKREDLENMSDADLSLLNRVLDAMEVGLMPSQASKLAQTIEAQRTANSINEQTQQEKSIVGKVFDAIDTPIRELASGKAKRVRRQMIKSQSTTADSSFGFKGKAISKALEPFNIAYGELEAQANKYKGMLARAIKNIKKSQASDIRGFLYMAEMHRNANPQSNKAYTVKQLIDVLTGTTEARETYISNYGEKRYKEILKTYDKFKDENGELDAKKLYESMSKAERDYVSTAEIIFSENTEFARDARWVRGESFEELNYYMHYPVVMQASKSDVNASVDNMMNSGIVRPSTKAGNLEERTEGVKLVSFSLAESVQNSYQQTLEDYYLTQPLRTERKAFNMFEKMNSNNDEMFSFASGVNKGAEDFRRYLLVSKQVSNFNNPITNAIKAGAYRYMLGSTARAVKEVLSNQAYVAMSDLVNFETASFKSFEIAKKTLAEPDWLFKAVANLPISDKQRILGNAVFAGQADAATMLGEDVGFTARAQSLETRIGKGIEAMQDLGITVNIKGNRIRISNKAYMEALLKTPDMFYSRGVFFDKLQRAYKKETGESLDLDKLTDKKFINDNRVLFDKITKEASAAVRKAFSTTNLAERSGVQLKASAEGGMFNAVKYFMLPFVINEYEQLRMAAVEDGLFGGLKTAIPILSRFAVYGALTGALTRAIAAALSDEDEPIEDILPSKDEFMKSLISSVVTLTLQRNWTFAPRAASNYVIEYLNKEFGEGITRESKEYDKFKDNIMFNRMNLDDVMGMRWTEMAQIIAPQYSPLLSSYEAAMKSTDERNKQRKEYLEWKALVTALAGLGFLPRDVRDIYIYSNEDVRDLIFEDKKKGVSGTIKGGSSSGALSGGRGTTIKGAAR